MKKLEHFSVQKVTGDGRCLFRALVLSFVLMLLAFSKIYVLAIRMKRLKEYEKGVQIKVM